MLEKPRGPPYQGVQAKREIKLLLNVRQGMDWVDAALVGFESA